MHRRREAVRKNIILSIFNPSSAIHIFADTPYKKTIRLEKFISIYSDRIKGSSRSRWCFYSLFVGRTIVQVVPFAFTTASAALFLVFAVRVMIMLSLNVSLGGAFFPNHGFGNVDFALVMFFSARKLPMKENVSQ